MFVILRLFSLRPVPRSPIHGIGWRGARLRETAQAYLAHVDYHEPSEQVIGPDLHHCTEQLGVASQDMPRGGQA